MGAPKNIIAESFVVTVAPNIHERSLRNSSNGDSKVLTQVTCSLSPINQSLQSISQDYYLLSLDITIAANTLPGGLVDHPAEQNDGLNELVDIILSSTTTSSEPSWSGRVFLVVPNRSGYIGRAKCFQQLFTGCADLGLVHDRTNFAKGIQSVPLDSIKALLSGYLLAIVREHNGAGLCAESALLQAIKTRLDFKWCFDQQPKLKTLEAGNASLNEKHKTKAPSHDAESTALVGSVTALKGSIKSQPDTPQYPLITKPSAGKSFYTDNDGRSPKLSARGTDWSKLDFGHSQEDLYDPVNNPSGVVRLTNANNGFLHDDLIGFINSHVGHNIHKMQASHSRNISLQNHFDKETCSYGKGDTGTVRLQTAMANHLNQYFAPVKNFDSDEVTFAAGVTSLNEISAMVLCNPGDSIMIGRPSHGGFDKDLCLRTGVNIEWVSFSGNYQFSLLEITDYDAAFEEAKARGNNIRALLICNPHNPLGQCYPPDTLKAVMEFCASKGIHLVSDEIYALSTYKRDDRLSEKFTSVRAIDYSGIIDPRQVHVLYGMSKDYGAGGMRLGCVISQNPDFTKAVRAVCRFSSPSKFSMNLATKFLEDREFVHRFLQKSQRMLLQSRLYAEELLKQTDIPYHDKGNSGLAIWLDLTGFIPSLGAKYDPWFTEQLIAQRFKDAGVLIDPGAVFSAATAGRFRLVFSVDSDTLREGIKRMNYVLQHF